MLCNPEGMSRNASGLLDSDLKRKLDYNFATIPPGWAMTDCFLMRNFPYAVLEKTWHLNIEI